MLPHSIYANLSAARSTADAAHPSSIQRARLGLSLLYEVHRISHEEVLNCPNLRISYNHSSYDRSNRLLIHRLCLQSSATSRVAYAMRCRLIFDFFSGREGRSEINMGDRLLVTPMFG